MIKDAYITMSKIIDNQSDLASNVGILVDQLRLIKREINRVNEVNEQLYTCNARQAKTIANLQEQLELYKRD